MTTRPVEKKIFLELEEDACVEKVENNDLSSEKTKPESSDSKISKIKITAPGQWFASISVKSTLSIR